MKKLIVGIVLILMICLTVNAVVFAETAVESGVTETNTNKISGMKEKISEKIAKYSEDYESEAYGMAAFVLNAARIYSIPICFVGIVIGALNQYVLGTRRLDKKHKGYGIIMTFVTLLVICQVLPLIFTVVVMGWRG